MNTILAALFFFVVAAAGILALWNILAIVYHTVMILLCATGYAIITAWEVLNAVAAAVLVRPIRALLRLAR